MCGHEKCDRRKQRRLFNPIEANAFEVPEMYRTGPERDYEHRQVCKVGDEIIVEQGVIGPVQEVNHD
jgi:hypothetical protein